MQHPHHQHRRFKSCEGLDVVLGEEEEENWRFKTIQKKIEYLLATLYVFDGYRLLGDLVAHESGDAEIACTELPYELVPVVIIMDGYVQRAPSHPSCSSSYACTAWGT